MLAEGNTFWTDQFNNQRRDSRATWGFPSAASWSSRPAGAIDAFCGAVGARPEMIAGVSKALKAGGCQARIVALEPATSPLLTCRVMADRTASKGSRRGSCHRI